MSIEDLITRHLQGRTRPGEEARLLEWRRRAPENEEEYHTLSGLWSLVSAASPIRNHGTVPDVSLIIAEADGNTAVERLEPKEPTPLVGAARNRGRSSASSVRRFLVGALAASVAILGIRMGLFSSAPSGQPGESAYGTVVTSSDAGVTLTLYDGTAVRLAPSSELQVIEGGDHPVVRLRGRAYFGVVPNPSRTFTVQTEYGDATALGTRFEVRADERELQVLVVQGNVRVSSASSAVEIGEGMMSRSVESGPLSTSQVDDVDALLDWVGQTLVFRATPLRRVVAEIERRYDVTITLEETSLALLEVTAVFTDQPVEDVIFVVCRIVGTQCARDEGRFRIGVDSRATGILRADSSRRDQ